MRSLLASAAMFTLLAAPLADAAEPKSEQDKMLYALGVAVSQNLTEFNLTEAELAMVQAGMADAALGRTLKVQPDEYMPKLRELHASRTAASAEVQKKAGQSFLDQAAKAPGAAKTSSGLIIETIKPGTGPSPTAEDTVRVHYHGTLIDGKVFDSSVRRGEPATFPLNGVIPCWTEGVQMMKVGGKSKLICPPNLAYGDRGAGADIKPGSTLIFEVELLGIEKAPAKQ